MSRSVPMKIAIVAPSPVPYVIGGAENLWWGLLQALNDTPGIQAELIKVPSPERNLAEIISSYQQYAQLDLDHFDAVITTKYPAWAIRHRQHVVYLQHTLRGLYDTYRATNITQLSMNDQAQLRSYGVSERVVTALVAVAQDGAPLLLDPASLPQVIAELQLAIQKHPKSMLWIFPGMVARAVVRLFDQMAMHPSRVIHHAAIAQTVAKREGYFPQGVLPAVYHHPTALAGLMPATAPGSYFFSASRLVSDKRIDLLIDAYAHYAKMETEEARIPLKIAGTGPAEDALRAQAAGISGIEFLGRITDEALAEYYNHALCVPFVPYQEDYGLITVEAFHAAKPVITVSDAGGPTELVTPGETGWVTNADPVALAGAFLAASQDRLATHQMGLHAYQRVQSLTWANLVKQLLSVVQTPTVQRRVAHDRTRLLMVNTFPIAPVVSGGQVRLAGLYGALAASQQVQVTAMTLATSIHHPIERELSPGLLEKVYPKPEVLKVYETELMKELGVSAGDVSVAWRSEYLSDFRQAIADEARDADVLVCAHPYAYPLIADLHGADLPLVYEAHNVEVDLKASMYQRLWAVEAVERLEQVCAQRAQLVTVCSAEDGARMHALYGVPSPLILSNGVNVQAIPYINLQQRQQYQQASSMTRPCALFMGSDHAPNREALAILVRTARALPELDIVVLGSVERGLSQALGTLSEVPENLRCLGVLDEVEKLAWLHRADLGLNPMLGGSGTNLKMHEYAAAGLLMVSTRFGARGSVWQAGLHYVVSDDETHAWIATIKEALWLSPATRQSMVQQAYLEVRMSGDWTAIAAQWLSHLKALRP